MRERKPSQSYEAIRRMSQKYHTGLGYRHQQCVVLFCCLTISYVIRSCMSVALVAMTTDPNLPIILNHKLELKMDTNLSIYNNTNSNITDDALRLEDSGNATHEFELHGVLNGFMLVGPYPTFPWNKKTQDTILSSFFWGYMTLQIPASMLAHRFGTRYLLCASMIINGIVFLVLPWAAFYGGWIYTMLCRFLQGLAQACLLPSIHTFCGRWAPIEERGRMTGLIYGGQAAGIVLGVVSTGFIASSGMGWPGIFRLNGILSIAVAVLMWFFLADTPAEHPKISAIERMYIEEELGTPNKHSKVPWGEILRCPAVYAIVAAHVGQAWGQLILYTEVPAYMDKVMGVNIKANGILSALPFLFMWMSNFLFSYLVDMFIKKDLPVTTTRKIANSFGSICASIGFIVLCYIPKNIYIVESVLILICALKMASQLGYLVINIDMTPNFSGPLISISNFVANAVGSFAPVVAGVIITDPTSAHLWSYLFFITAGLYLISNIIFVIFASADKVAWNDQPEESSDIENNEENIAMVDKQEKEVLNDRNT